MNLLQTETCSELLRKAYQLRRPERACKSSNNQQGQPLNGWPLHVSVVTLNFSLLACFMERWELWDRVSRYKQWRDGLLLWKTSKVI